MADNTNDVTPEQRLDPRTIRCPECGDLWDDHGMNHPCSPRVWPVPSVEAEAGRIAGEFITPFKRRPGQVDAADLVELLLPILQREARAIRGRNRARQAYKDITAHPESRAAADLAERAEKAQVEIARLRETLRKIEKEGCAECESMDIAHEALGKAEAAPAEARKEPCRDPEHTFANRECLLDEKGELQDDLREGHERLSLLEGLLGEVMRRLDGLDEAIFPPALDKRIRAALGEEKGK